MHPNWGWFFLGCLAPFFLSGAGFCLVAVVGWVAGWHHPKTAFDRDPELYDKIGPHAYRLNERVLRARLAASDRAAVDRLIEEITPKRAQNGGAL